MARFPSRLAYVLCALWLGLAAAFAGSPAAAQERAAPESREQIMLSFAPVVKRAAPAVVNIYTKKVVRQRRGGTLFNDPLFRRFFGEDFGFFGQPRERVQNSLGSGVIVDAEGLVMTNHHVIEGADEIRVVLSDLREYEAKLVLSDEQTDLAVLRIEPAQEPLPVLELRDSDDLEVGDLVLAIGNPFGVGQTVTSGIVSARARTQVGISDFSFFIQTDAAINPGNSGGALVALDGRLVGINTAIFSRSGGSIGIGFAIPANMVRTVIASAKGDGRIVRPWLGFVGQTLTAELAEGFGLSRPGGVLVNQLYPEGPADLAGLRVGDVIVAVGDQGVTDVDSLKYRVATGLPGEQVPVEVWRDRTKSQVQLPLMPPPERPPRDPRLLRGQHPLAGAVAANLSPALSEELDLPGAWQGVILIDVKRGSPARRFRFRPGDVILAVNDIEVGDTRALPGLLDGEASWTIKFRREGRVKIVRIEA